MLVTEIQDKIIQTIELLQKDKVIDPSLTLREVYNKYLHPETMDIEDVKVWNGIKKGNILDLFQFDSMQGAKAIKTIQPENMIELASANGLIRLVSAEKGAEQPMDKFARFKKDIDCWFEEMKKYGLTKEERKLFLPYMLEYHGMCFSQEQIMRIVMDEQIAGFSLGEANTLRKVIGKKQMSRIPEMQELINSKATSARVAKYIWEQCARPQLSYSFSIIHAIAYSFIGYQTALLATKFNPIYWNTACLIVNSGALEEAPVEEEIVSIYEKEDDKDATYEDLPDRSGKKKRTVATDYAKLAKAIGDTMRSGIKISLVNINESSLGFVPDVKNNQILFGLKAVTLVGDEVVEQIIANRPYSSFDDFLARVNPNKQAVLMLIKAGAFDCFEDRIELMKRYIASTSDQKKKLTLANFNGLCGSGLIPEELKFEKEIFFFNKYIKKGKKTEDSYILDDIAQSFYFKNFDDCLILTSDDKYLLNIKDWDKIYQAHMDKVRDWLEAHKEEMLEKFNNHLFQENWDKYCATDNISAWEMDALCFYYHEHELAGVDTTKYGISDFMKLNAEPEVERTIKRGDGEIPLYKIYKIAGTVIAKNKLKSTISLLTTSGVVTVKFRKEQFALYDKQISEIQPDKSKKVIEKSWFNRGNILMIQGFRRDDSFVVKKYSKTPGHTVYKINEILENKDLVLQDQRSQGD